MKNFSLQKRFATTFVLSIFSLSLAFSFLVNVTPAFADCTDPQVDAWLSSKGLVRNSDNLHQAYAALGNCSGGAEGNGAAITTVAGFLNRVIAVINILIPFLVGLAIFIIIYGIFSYISSAADEEARKQARDFIIWGVIGVVLMLSVWGLVNILYNTLGIDSTNETVRSRYPSIPLIGPQ